LTSKVVGVKVVGMNVEAALEARAVNDNGRFDAEFHETGVGFIE